MAKKLNNKGFTLLEVIVSIATLALISGFILQMFIASNQGNVRAQNIDNASIKAMAIMENLQAQNSYKNFKETGVFANASVISANEQYYIWFDADWNELPASLVDVDLSSFDSATFPMAFPTDFNSNAPYVFVISLQGCADINNEATTSGFSTLNAEVTKSTINPLATIKVSAYDLKRTEDKRLLVEYETNKYFTE